MSTSHRGSTTSKYGFGWLPDAPDSRDYTYDPLRETLQRLPKRVDLRNLCPAVYAQESLESCSANAVAAAVQFDLMRENRKRVIFPSRLFLYYNARAIEGTTRQNTGTSVRDTIKSVAKLGVCPESLWPYIEKNFRRKPPRKCYAKAIKDRVVEYRRVKRNIDHFRACLASGYPFVFGFTAYDLFRDVVWESGQLEMPRPHEGKLGSHAVMAVGYEHDRKRLIVRNSWGREFGFDGYFTMPYEYLKHEAYSSDFWTIRFVS
jgi:C1A family cysteine protease